jgi:H+/Cl- antiporter ClcA
VTETANERVSGRFYLTLVLLGAAIGIPAALAGFGLLEVVHLVEQWLWVDLPDALGEPGPPWWLLLLLPVVGAGIVLVAVRWLPGNGGHEPLDGVQLAPTPLSHLPGIALAAIGSLAFGAVLGPEGPLIAIGAAMGLLLAPFVDLGSRGRQVMATAGSFSAVSALFGGPLVASFMLVEAGLGLGAAVVPALVPGFVAAAVGYVVFTGIGAWSGLTVASLSVPDLPAYSGTRLVDLLLAVVAGVVTALVVQGVRRVAVSVDEVRRRFGHPVLLAGALLVGALAVLADLLGVDGEAVLFSGQTSVPTLVSTGTTGAVVVLLAFKALAYAVCLGCGFRGGPVFPAIFTGVAVMTLAVLWFDVSPTLAVAIGTAAGMTSMTSFLFSSVLFAALLTGRAGVDAIPAAVLAAVSAWLTVQVLRRRSADEEVVV